MNKPAHFSLKELTATSTNLDNSISSWEVIENLEWMCGYLELIRERFGSRPLKINSGYRSQAVNKAVNGARTSAHCRGLAVDVCPSDKSLLSDFKNMMVQRVKTSLYPIDQLIIYDPFVHIGFSHNPRLEILYK